MLFVLSCFQYLPSGPTRKAATDRIGSPGLNTPRHVGRGAAASGRGAPSPSTTTPRYTSTPRRGGNPRSRTPPIDGRELFRSAHLRNTTATPRSMASSMSTPYSRGSSSGGIGSGARAASPYHATPPGPPASAVPGWVRTGGSPPPTPPSGAMPPPIPSNMPSGASDVDVHAVLVKVNDALYQHHGSIRNTFMKYVVRLAVYTASLSHQYVNGVDHIRMRSSKAGVSASDMKTGLHRIGCNIRYADRIRRSSFSCDLLLCALVSCTAWPMLWRWCKSMDATVAFPCTTSFTCWVPCRSERLR